MSILPYNTINKAWEVINTLNHETRKDLLTFIHAQDNAPNVTEIYCRLRIDQSVVSQHLALLLKIGAVTNSRTGKFVCYSINKSFMIRAGYYLRLLAYIASGFKLDDYKMKEEALIYRKTVDIENIVLWARQSFPLVRALRNPLRIELLKEIIDAYEVKVSYLYKDQAREQSIISQQLRILRLDQKPDAILKPAFVKVRREGRRLYYSVNDTFLFKVQDYLIDISNLIPPPTNGVEVIQVPETELLEYSE